MVHLTYSLNHGVHHAIVLLGSAAWVPSHFICLHHPLSVDSFSLVCRLRQSLGLRKRRWMRLPELEHALSGSDLPDIVLAGLAIGSGAPLPYEGAARFRPAQQSPPRVFGTVLPAQTLQVARLSKCTLQGKAGVPHLRDAIYEGLWVIWNTLRRRPS